MSENSSNRAGDEKRSILLVEDYEGNIIVALHFLEGEGFSVVVAHNGNEALSALEKQKFDLILMDIQMPTMDGYTATRMIRERETNANLKATPIIGMTANAFKEDRQKCLEAGMDDYISKPYNFDDLAEKIEYQILKNQKPYIP